ncbi:MAG TPA: hypothetical protein ENF30_02195 [Candidatus Desulfofervidus auxilii]|uniref:DUF2066 domain-containing protein n=1 Tax=Desulfofervidus auxilii TaxID=1621989 RepID=A0A7V0IAH2_DESA2|nr:hypothetical protein [Candidatus Desulfofervidus auxilii]
MNWPVFGKYKIVLLFLILFIKPTWIGAQTIIATGIAPLKDNMVKAQQTAIKTALINATKKAIKTVSPFTNLLPQEEMLEFIKSYRLLQEKEMEESYFVEVEAEIDWNTLSKCLDELRIIQSNDGEKILLFFTLPQGIDFKTPLLSFWQRFFLIFNLTPVYEETLYKEQLLNYAFKRGIPFLLNFSLINQSTNKNKWHFVFVVELINTIYHQTIYQTKIEKISSADDIETLIHDVLKFTQDIAYNLAGNLSFWLTNHREKITYFEIIFKNIQNYKTVFTIWERMKKNGISIYIKEISSKRIIYSGKYRGGMPELVNELSGLGFVVEGVKGNTVYLSLQK